MIFPFSHPVIALLLVIYPSRHRPSVAKLAAVLVTCFVCPRRNRRQMAGGWSNDAETSHKSIWVCCWNGKQTPMGWKSGFPFFWAIECGVTQFPKPYGSKKTTSRSRPAICDQLIGLKIAAAQDELGLIRQVRPEISELHIVPSGSDLVRNFSAKKTRDAGWCWMATLDGYGSIPINTIFRGMNIHLPAILMWTTGVQGFDTLPDWQIPSPWVPHGLGQHRHPKSDAATAAGILNTWP